MERDVEHSMRSTETLVDAADSTKTQEWRVYNIMRVRNSPEIRHGRESRIVESADWANITLSSISGLEEDRIDPQERLIKLHSIFTSAANLATDLKTQKSVFELDQRVEPDVPYDPLSMTEIQGLERNY
ncbi:hypothetical protein RUND412_010464 [Rhizina undulata]